MDVPNDVIQKTQKTLGKYVKKPPLTDKLLKKPPFRFLHDIIKTVIKETGFLGDLFSENELNYENVKEKDAKIAFLTKLIDVTKSVSETQLVVKPSKIVAGLEPVETNKLLQAIAKAIDKKADISEYLNKVKNGENLSQEKSKTKKTTETASKTKTSKTSVETSKTTKKSTGSNNAKLKRSSSKDSDQSARKLTDRRDSSRDKKINDDSKNSSRKKTKQPEISRPTEKGESEQVLKSSTTDAISISKNEHKSNIEKNVNEIEKPEAAEDNGSNDNQLGLKSENKIIEENPSDVVNDNLEVNNGIVDSREVMKTRQPSANLIRPKSARIKLPQSTPIKPDHTVQIPPELSVPSTSNEPKMTQQRPGSSLRPPSVRPSSARPGAPRLRPDSALPMSETVTMGNINVIVENFDNADDEETVIIQNSGDTVEEDNVDNRETTQLGALIDSGENKGQLVEQILEQIQESEGDTKKFHIDWEPDVHSKDSAAKEINQLRSLIQSLTKTANPLGKLLNYLHEDLEAMHNELQMWTNSKRQLYAEIEKQKKINNDHSKPLLAQLKLIQQEIKKYEQDILILKSTVLKNDIRIKELIGKY